MKTTNELKDFLENNPEIENEVLKDTIADQNKKIDFLYYIICTLLGIMVIPKILQFFM